MANPLKRLLKSDAAIGLLATLAAGYIRLVKATTRWRHVNAEVLDPFRAAGEPVIGVFWHNRLVNIRWCWPRDYPLHMLISRHGDGRVIARCMHKVGIPTIDGSTSKGAVGATKAMARLLKQGTCVGITPDGPRGPRMRAAPGVIGLARLTGRAIVPTAQGLSRRRTLGSWDRMSIGLPFGRGVYVFGAPIHVPRNATPDILEAKRLELEAALTAITDEADRLTGHPPTPPAPWPDGKAPGEARA